MKLGYLHPAVFTPDSHMQQKYGLSNQYIIIRLARLTAHHDFGIRGMDQKLIAKIISVVEERGIEVKISAEAEIDPQFKKFLLRIEPGDMHHVLAQAALLISDSQSMSVEAAMLGVPSIRYSDFAGKISVLEELEHTYGLTYGIPVGSEERIITKLTELVQKTNLKDDYQQKKKRMLQDKINVTAFLVWFLENYPSSAERMKSDPEYQTIFR